MAYKLLFSELWPLFCFIRFFIKVYCMNVTIELLLCHKYLENSPPKMSRDSKYLSHCLLVSANILYNRLHELSIYTDSIIDFEMYLDLQCRYVYVGTILLDVEHIN